MSVREGSMRLCVGGEGVSVSEWRVCEKSADVSRECGAWTECKDKQSVNYLN